MRGEFIPIRCVALLASAICIFAGVCAGEEAESPLDGDWAVVGLKRDGRSVSEVSFRGMKWSFQKGSYTMTAGTRTPAGMASKPPLQGPFRVDDDKSPKHFSFTMVGRKSKLEVNGIYQIKERKLELCFGSGERPTTFDTTGNRSLCYELKRVERLPDQQSESEDSTSLSGNE